MNSLWLLLIVPGCVFLGMCITGLLIKVDNYDANRAEMAERHYAQLRAIIEDAWPKPKGLPELLDRHEAESIALAQ